MAKTYNTFTNVSTGDVLSATTFNNVLTNIAGYRVPPMVRCSPGSSVTKNTDISWGSTATFDTDSMFSSSAATKISINTTGVYLVSVGLFLSYTGGPNTIEEVQIYKTGSVIAQHTHSGISTNTGNFLITLETIVQATATTDYFTARANCTGTFSAVQSDRTWFAATWLGQSS